MTAGSADGRPASAVGRATGAIVAAVAGGIVVMPELLTPIALVMVLRRVPGPGWWRRGALAAAIAAAAAWATPFVVGGDPLRGASAFLEAAAVGLVFSVFASLPPPHRPALPVVVGVIAGLALAALASAAQVAGATGGAIGTAVASWVPSGIDPLLHPGRAAGWVDHPNVWAARVVLPAVLVAAVGTRPTLVVAAQGLAWVTVLASGSRSAAAALVLGSAVALALRHLLSKDPARVAGGAAAPAVRRRTAAWLPAVVLGTLLVAASLAVLAAPAGARFSLVGTAPSDPRSEHPRNLLRASEDVATDRVAWKLQGVSVEAAAVRHDGARAWLVTKVTDAPDARAYAEIGLEPGSTYTLSFAHGPGDAATVPGIAGWGRTADDAPHHTLNLRRIDGAWSVRTEGDLTAGTVRVAPGAAGWDRLSVTFTYGGDERVTWRVGPTPDQRPGTRGGTMLVAALQLERGHEPTAYDPTSTGDRIRAVAAEAAASRAAVFAEAWRGFLARPLTGAVGAGWGAATGGPEPLATARHGHNLVLAPLHERGVAGGAAIVLLVLAIAVAGRRGGALPAGVLVAVLALNTVDFTFWTAGVAFPMAAAVGWSVSRSRDGTAEP